MTDLKTKRTHFVTCLLALGFISGALSPVVGAPAHAEIILHDSLSITESGNYSPTSATQSFIGGAAMFGSAFDHQSADAFSIDDTYVVSSVTADFIVNAFGLPTVGLPADGVLVELFADKGGKPSEQSHAAVLVDSDSVSGESFSNPHNGSWQDEGLRITVDVSDAGIMLGAGTWWLSVVPVDMSASGLPYTNVVQDAGGDAAFALHTRSGGDAHGNGLPGTYSSEWTTTGSTQYDMAFQVTAVPAPGVLSLLAVLGLFARARCRLRACA